MADVEFRHRFTLPAPNTPGESLLKAFYETVCHGVPPEAAPEIFVYKLLQVGKALEDKYHYPIYTCLASLGVYLQEDPSNPRPLSRVIEDSLIPKVEYGGFIHFPEAHQIVSPYLEDPADLTRIENLLLFKLISNGGRYVTYPILTDVMEASLGNVFDANLLKTHMTHVREKIGDTLRVPIDGRLQPRHIRNRATVGYGFFAYHPLLESHI